MFVYIHLPFCLSRCIYCDFFVVLHATPERRRAYLEALKTEIRGALSGYDHLKPIETVYLGGGTPALLPAEELAEILETLTQFAPFAPEAELTLEVNPDRLASSPQAYQAIGINRVSLGVQSLRPNELKRLSRIHSVPDVVQVARAFQDAGLTNLSVDLMYGIPEQTPESWLQTLDQVVTQIQPAHVSMYGLKVEPLTKLDTLIASARLSVPSDEDTVLMYESGLARLAEAGFTPYEISNLAQPGCESRHNLNYWDGGDFWGFGAGAHGYVDSVLYENPRDWRAYLANPTERAEAHIVSSAEALENAFIFGLRKRAGVSIPVLEARYGFDFNTHYLPRLRRYLEAGLLRIQNGHLRLSDEAIPVSNTILAEFLEENLAET